MKKTIDCLEPYIIFLKGSHIPGKKKLATQNLAVGNVGICKSPELQILSATITIIQIVH